MTALSFRPGGVADSALVFRYLQGLVAHEGSSDFRLTQERLQEILSGHPQAPRVMICEAAGQPVGMAMWMARFSAHSGGMNMWLLDLFIDAPHRRQGIGGKIFAELTRIAKAENFSRIEWFVSAHNDAAKAFYRKTGGVQTTHTERWRIAVS